jgi:hypothetical protein
MKSKMFILFIISFAGIFTHAQTKTEDFKITLPESKVSGCLYNSIRLLDIRNDTTDFGIVQKGTFNKKVKVVAETAIATQFNNLLNAMIDNTAQNGELLLLLRQLSFAEVIGAMSERGYFHFRAVLFANKNGGYKKIETIDTVVLVKAMDVTKKMFRLGSKTITDFIASNLTKEVTSDFSLLLDQLPSIDSIEKSRLPLYTATTYTDGLYYNFQSFVNQQPDETGVSVKFDKKGKVQKISYVNKKGQASDIENQFIYAFVYEGKLFISGEFACYPLEKRGNDFYFTGKANDAKSGDVVAATAFFGIIGGLMASSATSIFEMKIDHLSGGFIRIKEVNK